MMNPLIESEPENMELIKKEKMKPIRECPLPDDLYDEKGDMKC